LKKEADEDEKGANTQPVKKAPNRQNGRRLQVRGNGRGKGKQKGEVSVEWVELRGWSLKKTGKESDPRKAGNLLSDLKDGRSTSQ